MINQKHKAKCQYDIFGVIIMVNISAEQKDMKDFINNSHWRTIYNV